MKTGRSVLIRVHILPLCGTLHVSSGNTQYADNTLTLYCLLLVFSSFEYPPAFYGLFDHSGNELPLDKQIWDLVPRTSVELPDVSLLTDILSC